MDTLIVAFAGACLAALVSTWTGFGGATVLTPVLALFFDLRTTIFVVAVFHMSHNVVKLASFYPHIVWRRTLDFGAGAIVASYLGSSLSAYVPVAVLRVLLGSLIIIDAGLSLSGNRKLDGGPPGTPLAILGGALSGFAAGVIGTGGAIRAAFLNRFVREKSPYVATSATIGTLIDFTRIPVYFSQYPENATENLPLIASVIVAGFTGVTLARYLLQKVDSRQFQRILLWSLFAVGIVFVVQGIRGA